MSEGGASTTTLEATSALHRIETLRRHDVLFEHIATQPRSGIYDRFGRLWPKINAVIEGEVHRRDALFNAFICKDSIEMSEGDAQIGLWNVNMDLTEVLILHEKVVRAWQTMSSAPPVSDGSMEDYRNNSNFCNGNVVAANGQSLLLYSNKGTSIPDVYATICDEDFDRIEQAIADWFMEPFLNFVNKPIRSILLKIPGIREMFHHQSADVLDVGTGAIAACARSFMVMTAILCATAAIFVLNQVKDQQMRIVVMGLFALAFALPAQHLSSRFMPICILILT
ncbi:hypothetical protein DE146DRAFT_634124 [Phaeosphaeria sp. MPI-PUGE-AT-0046c]|nr:hypothetical protein DE146DRAFT_634124 [Phaeosphaeria sp. MPI-PUGE-AT-0046c]